MLYWGYSQFANLLLTFWDIQAWNWYYISQSHGSNGSWYHGILDDSRGWVPLSNSWICKFQILWNKPDKIGIEDGTWSLWKGWLWFQKNLRTIIKHHETISICTYTYIYIYGSVSRVANPPPHPPWYGSKTYVLATFSWNPPKHMVFTMFWQARPPKPWYLQRFVILHCILLLL